MSGCYFEYIEPISIAYCSWQLPPPLGMLTKHHVGETLHTKLKTQSHTVLLMKVYKNVVGSSCVAAEINHIPIYDLQMRTKLEQEVFKCPGTNPKH